jgi:sortase A
MVGADISDAGLARGPGHYPTTALPGRAGNMAVAGHRTGWGSPFLHFDDLRAGDEIVVDDRRGRTHVYTVAQVLLVEPDADWVLRPDPMGTGQRTLTLTTCDPPWLNSRRLIVFAVLDDGGSGPPVA